MIPYNQIREHYRYLTPLIFERSEIHPRNWVSPYCDIDWMSLFTPIENQAWQAIRAIGKIPLYPQYPIKGYFVDFGNPYLKIAVECDGKEYHLDKDKDAKRDNNLMAAGWKVFRIPGSDCVRPVSDDYYNISYIDESERYGVLDDFYQTTIEGLVKALAIHYCEFRGYYLDEHVCERSISSRCIYERKSQFDKRFPVERSTN